MMISKFNRFVLLVSFSFVFSFAVNALSIEQLISEEKLMVKVDVVSDEPFIAKQPIKISVELLTDRWFGSGNKIHDFNLDNIIKLPFDEQTTNSSLRYKGKQWASQQREITIFPLAAGVYELPPLTLDIVVNTQEGEVKGSIKTQSIVLDVILPTQLTHIEHYVVTDSFKLTTAGEFDDKNAYRIGEAVTLSIELKANDVPAMMLPVLPELDIPGVAIYSKKPQLVEKSNRGTLVSKRIEQLNFIFEQPGDYSIPELTFYWWNVTNNSLEVVTIAEQTWQVSNQVLSNESASKTSVFKWLNDIELKYLMLILLLVIAVLWLLKVLIVNQSAVITFYQHVSHYKQRQLEARFLKSISQESYPQACQYLYRLLPHIFTKNSKKTNSSVPNTLTRFYKKNSEQSHIVEVLINNGFFHYQREISLHEAKKLLKPIERELSIKADTYGNAIRLNPNK